jgi:hypothetical protein
LIAHDAKGDHGRLLTSVSRPEFSNHGVRGQSLGLHLATEDAVQLR